MRPVSAVVLAAGRSRRYVEAGHGLKQLLPFGGESLVRRTTRAALASRATRVVVVVGCRAGEVAAEVEDLDADVVVNEGFRDGQSSSVRAALRRIGTDAEAILFLPCDQPYLDAAAIDRIIDAYDRSGAGIVVPTFGGAHRAPVLFDRSFFARLEAITGDAGGRQLFDAHAESLLEVPFEDESPLLDVDTPADYARLLDSDL